MPAGIQIFNPDNSVQIDDTYFNLCVKGKVTVNSVYYNQGFFRSKVTYTFIGEYPLLAVRCDQPFGFVSSVTSSDETTHTFEFIVFAGSGTPMDIYILGRTTLHGNVGFQVFDASENIVFNSNEAYLNIVDGVNSAVFGDYVYDTSKTYACIFGSPYLGWSVRYTSMGQPGAFVRSEERRCIQLTPLAGGFRFNVGVYFTDVQQMVPGGSGFTYNYVSCQMLFVDITRAIQVFG